MIFLPQTLAEQSGIFWTWAILFLLSVAVYVAYFAKGKKNIKNKTVIPEYEPPAVSPFMANFLYARSGNSDFLPEIYSTQDQLLMLLALNNKGFFQKFKVAMETQNRLEIYLIEYVILDQYSTENLAPEEQKFIELFKKYLKSEGVLKEELKGEYARHSDHAGGFKELNKFWTEVMIYTEKLAREKGYLENKASRFLRLYADIFGLPYFLMFFSIFIVNMSKQTDSVPVVVKIMALPVTIVYYGIKFVSGFFGSLLTTPANWFFQMGAGIYFIFLFTWMLFGLPSVVMARSISYIFTDFGKQTVWKLVGYRKYLQTANHDGVVWSQEPIKDNELIPWLMIFENDSKRRFVIKENG
jgi:hypothetical protein